MAESSPQVTDVEALVAHFHAGSKTAACVGMEHEKIGVLANKVVRP